MSIVYFLFNQTLLFAIPLMIVALGAMFSERGGVVNLALEGIMVIGAFSGIFFMNWAQTNQVLSGMSLLFASMAIAALAGFLFSMLHAFAAINLAADQTISGTALNILGAGLAIFIAKTVQDGAQNISFTNEFRIESIPGLGSIPVLGDLLFKNCYITTFLGFLLLAFSWYLLMKTKFGLHLRSCGENPQAADAAGISVYKTRYAGVALSGILAGVGGLIYIIPISTEFTGTVAGYGFLALAVMIFGNYSPLRIGGAAFFFGFTKTISFAYSSIPFIAKLSLPDTFYKLIPYVATLILLAFTSKNSAAPRADGIPYDKSRR
ncbi:ABC transporter permease [Sharpea azabuensis]|uniref:ABC transporter permease n=1 Tax=Sharpea azabuensis TaxID=322505 RepID=UPI0013DB87A2|nr:ABC transporter permease [Sharpea azabuensis]MDD6513534.1 ABC transporter permease [Sharpea azabuensis]